MSLSTAELMAVQVLKGDMGASDQINEGHVTIGTVHRITVDKSRIRVAVFMKDPQDPNTVVDVDSVYEAVNRWLSHNPGIPPVLWPNVYPLVLVGVDRIEIFELPPTRQEESA
jgi:hypothetical protein